MLKIVGIVVNNNLPTPRHPVRSTSLTSLISTQTKGKTKLNLHKLQIAGIHEIFFCFSNKKIDIPADLTTSQATSTTQPYAYPTHHTYRNDNINALPQMILTVLDMINPTKQMNKMAEYNL